MGISSKTDNLNRHGRNTKKLHAELRPVVPPAWSVSCPDGTHPRPRDLQAHSVAVSPANGFLTELEGQLVVYGSLPKNAALELCIPDPRSEWPYRIPGNTRCRVHTDHMIKPKKKRHILQSS